MNETDCCPEYAAMSRRGLLQGALAFGASTTVFGTAVVTASPASAAPAPAVLVVVSLRGACDGLSLVVPHADPAYYAARPNIAIASDVLLAKDGMFGLHPAFEPLLPFWTAGKVAAVHATGLPAPNRSHFAAMEEVEDANPGSSVRSGWLNRLVGTDADANPLQGLNLGVGRRARLALRPAARDVGRQRRRRWAWPATTTASRASAGCARCTRSGTATPPRSAAR